MHLEALGQAIDRTSVAQLIRDQLPLGEKQFEHNMMTFRTVHRFPLQQIIDWPHGVPFAISSSNHIYPG